MHLAAMLDLGLPEPYLLEELSKLGLEDEYDIDVKPAQKMGIQGTQVRVGINEVKEPAHRHLADIRSIIEGSDLASAVKQRALSTFQTLAQAEAQVHGIDIEEVHFHEVGATDAIIDIVAAAVAIEFFKPEAVYCNGVELGSGMVRCAHGLMPVPAPATALLLEGKRTSRGNVTGEATTPTGASILNEVVSQWRYPDNFTTTRTAYGIGHKDFERPNALRVSLGELDSGLEQETNVLIECNIDDMSPEAYEPLMEQLFELGANDVFMTPIIMKKSRPGTKFSVLCNTEVEEVLVSCILERSTSIGVRTSKVSKHMLTREIRSVETPLGTVQVKISQLPSGGNRWKVEHDDIKSIANRSVRNYLSTKAEIDRWIAIELGRGDVD